MKAFPIFALLPLVVYAAWVWAIRRQISIFRACRRPDSEGELAGWRDSALRAALLWGAYLALSSEVLSLFHALTGAGVLGVWALALAVTLALVGKPALAAWRGRPPARLSLRIGGESLLGGLIALFCAILLVIAVLAPPNTNDALQYHLSRVMHWVQDGSLQFYATPADRQIWMPVWAETAILNFVLLAGSDRWANLVQWGIMLLALAGISLAAARLGAGRRAQLLAAAFAVSLPMGILQASSSQNDYVTAAWAVCLAYFCLRLSLQSEFSWPDLGFAALAAGLGVLTKGTFFVFALPFLAGLGAALWLKFRPKVFFQAILAGGLVVAALNAGFWSRNLATYGSLTGPEKAMTGLVNQAFGWQPLVSNLVRNATLQLGTPYDAVNGPLLAAVTGLHTWLGLDVSDPRLSLDDYWVKRLQSEDYASNIFHFLSIIPTLLLLAPAAAGLWRRVDRHYLAESGAAWQGLKPALLYAGGVLLTYVFFALVFKWQRTGSRLLLAFFVLWAPVFGLALQNLGKSRLSRLAGLGLALLLMFGSTKELLSNPSRPLLPLFQGGPSLLSTSRTDLLFANYREAASFYLPLIETIKAQGCTRVGLMLDSRDMEYPLWALLSPSGTEVHFEHLRAAPGLERYIHDQENFCAIVCDQCKQASLHGLQRSAQEFNIFSLYLPAGAARP